eukprot:scaffold3581_cov252-Pinguiococcus_pyrenoidosus.AAC.10
MRYERPAISAADGAANSAAPRPAVAIFPAFLSIGRSGTLGRLGSDGTLTLGSSGALISGSFGASVVLTLDLVLPETEGMLGTSALGSSIFAAAFFTAPFAAGAGAGAGAGADAGAGTSGGCRCPDLAHVLAKSWRSRRRRAHSRHVELSTRCPETRAPPAAIAATSSARGAFSPITPRLFSRSSKDILGDIRVRRALPGAWKATAGKARSTRHRVRMFTTLHSDPGGSAAHLRACVVRPHVLSAPADTNSMSGICEDFGLRDHATGSPLVLQLPRRTNLGSSR